LEHQVEQLLLLLFYSLWEEKLKLAYAEPWPVVVVLVLVAVDEFVYLYFFCNSNMISESNLSDSSF
jgi:hypothetical protein